MQREGRGGWEGGGVEGGIYNIMGSDPCDRLGEREQYFNTPLTEYIQREREDVYCIESTIQL